MPLFIKNIKWTIRLGGKNKTAPFFPKLEPGKIFPAKDSDILEFVDKVLKRGATSRPLDVFALSQLEPVAEQDLKSVQIHTDELANLAAEKIGAQAFTVDKDIYFARGKFQPGSEEGMQLLRHEVTHIKQAEKGETKDLSVEKRRQLEQEALSKERSGQEEVRLPKEKGIQASMESAAGPISVGSSVSTPDSADLIAVKFEDGRVMNYTFKQIAEVQRMMGAKINWDLKIAKEKLIESEYWKFYQEYLRVVE